MSPPQAGEDATPWPSERYGWYVVTILCICGMVAFIDRQIINLLVEDIKRDLQISDTQISLLQGLAFALFYALAAVPLGRMADTGNRRILMALGLAVSTFAMAACGLAKNFWHLFLARMGVGVGEAVLTPAGFSMLADLFRPNRLALPLSVYTGSSFVGSGLALLAGGALIAYLGTLERIALPGVGELAAWEAAFIVGALPGLVMALVFFVTVREPRRRTTALTAASARLANPDRPTFAEVLRFCAGHSRVFLAVFGGVSLLAATQFALGAWVPAHFIRNHGWTPSDVGYAYGIIFLTCGSTGVFFGGWLADWLQSRGRSDGHLRVALLSALLCLPFACTFSLLADPVLSMVVLGAAVLCGTMAFGAGPALIPVICPSRMRGLLVALYLLVANLVGQAGGPWIVAVFTDYVFGAPEFVRYSLAVAPGILLSLGAVLIAGGFAGLRALRSADGFRT